MSNKNVLFIGLAGSKEWDCLLGRLVLVCKGMYAVPVKKCLPISLGFLSSFAFSSLLYWSGVLLPKLIPQVIDQSFKKIFLINVETGNTLYSEYLLNLSTYNMCKAVEGELECDLQDALMHHGSELV